jgi:hypothetical protein
LFEAAKEFNLCFTRKSFNFIRVNISENIYLKYEKSNKKYYVRDLTELGQCCEIGLDGGQPELIIEKGEPYKVTQNEAKQIMETSGYNFGKAELLPSGELEFFVTV